MEGNEIESTGTATGITLREAFDYISAIFNDLMAGLRERKVIPVMFKAP